MPIEGGSGGANTQTGMHFERNTQLRDMLNAVEEYQVDARGKVFMDGKHVADLCEKYSFYKQFLEPKGVVWKEHLSKRLLPDEALIVHNSKRVFIVEKKWQQCAGSVDEKLQTCDFKKKQYQKVVDSTGYQVEYLYLFNDWFEKPEYRDVLGYIEDVGCRYFFGEVELGYFFPVE